MLIKDKAIQLEFLDKFLQDKHTEETLKLRVLYFKLQADLEKLGKTYGEEITTAQKALKAKIDKYTAEEVSKTAAQNEERIKEVQEDQEAQEAQEDQEDQEDQEYQEDQEDQEDQGSHSRVRGPQQDQANLDEKARGHHQG